MKARPVAILMSWLILVSYSVSAEKLRPQVPRDAINTETTSMMQAQLSSSENAAAFTAADVNSIIEIANDKVTIAGVVRPVRWGEYLHTSGHGSFARAQNRDHAACTGTIDSVDEAIGGQVVLRDASGCMECNPTQVGKKCIENPDNMVDIVFYGDEVFTSEVDPWWGILRPTVYRPNWLMLKRCTNGSPPCGPCVEASEGCFTEVHDCDSLNCGGGISKMNWADMSHYKATVPAGDTSSTRIQLDLKCDHVDQLIKIKVWYTGISNGVMEYLWNGNLEQSTGTFEKDLTGQPGSLNSFEIVFKPTSLPAEVDGVQFKIFNVGNAFADCEDSKACLSQLENCPRHEAEFECPWTSSEPAELRQSPRFQMMCLHDQGLPIAATSSACKGFSERAGCVADSTCAWAAADGPCAGKKNLNYWGNWHGSWYWFGDEECTNWIGGNVATCSTDYYQSYCALECCRLSQGVETAPTCMSKMDAACGHWKACLTTASTFEGIKQILEGFNAGRAKWLDKYEGNPYFPQYLWTEHSYKHCYGTSHSTTYTTEQDARNACLNLGSDCLGVYDQLCDKQGPFRTCLASGPIRSSYAGSWGGASCVRTRPGAWTEHANKHCWSTAHATTYDTVQQAKEACLTIGPDCRGVYDNTCNNQGPFKTCQTSGTLQVSGSSCVHTPPGLNTHDLNMRGEETSLLASNSTVPTDQFINKHLLQTHAAPDEQIPVHHREQDALLVLLGDSVREDSLQKHSDATNQRRLLAAATTKDADGCKDPWTQDPESWDCACHEHLINQCGSDSVCFTNMLCTHNDVCQSWKDQNCVGETAMLQDKDTKAEDLISLLDEKANSKARVGWDCG